MTVFLGDSGRILLRRHGSDQRFLTVINEADLRTDVNRFSVDFAHEQIITGDRIEIRTTDETDITWINDDSVDDSFTRFVHVDAAGGIRMYDTFSEAIRGNAAGAIPLQELATDDDDEFIPQEVTIQIVNGDDDPLPCRNHQLSNNN